METSEQQRRPTVGQIAQALTTAKLDFDAIDLADMVWLAQFIEPGESQGGTPSPTPRASDSPSPPPPSPSLPSSDESGLREPEVEVYPEDAAPSVATPETEPEDATPTGTPFAIPAAPALRTPLNLARSLRPLMRKVPSRSRFELDETATVTQIAETEVWLPIVRPTPERWLELELVVESSKTTVIWERSIAELNHIAEYQGAFRAVRTWRLSAQGETVQLFPRWREGSVKQTESQLDNTSARSHTPRELIDPSGRRLIWFVTDCTSDLWRQGCVYPALQQWAAVQPMVIVQMLPSPLWKRTALRDGHQVRLSALAPGLPNARLAVDGLTRRLERRSRVDLVTVPVITLDAPAMQQWARVMAGMGDSRTPGRTFDLRFIERQAATTQTDRDERSPDAPTAQERVDLFRAMTASDTVKQLVNLMAATPVTLPVIDLLRDTFRADFKEEVRQSHVAEVLLSGLLRRCDVDEDEVCRYEFWGDDSEDPTERVRDILLGDTSITKTRQVLDVLSASICQKMNSPIKTFQALLAELNADEARDDLRSMAMPFAKIGLDVLYRLGGEHAAVARQYDPKWKQLPGGSIVGDDWLSGFTYEKLTYQVAEYIDFPPIEAFSFEEGELIDDETFPPPLKPDNFTIVTLKVQSLEPFDFITATLARNSETNQWEVEYQPGRAHRFIERLPGGIELEVVSIPGGTFLMGSPEDEPERSADEGPQREVTI
ncbi:MAG: SAV_2336 N-terminal domain-related protein, partial [Cyanobacteria bacterium J06559_3]